MHHDTISIPLPRRPKGSIHLPFVHHYVKKNSPLSRCNIIEMQPEMLINVIYVSWASMLQKILLSWKNG